MDQASTANLKRRSDIVYDVLASQIEDGRIVPGHRLPSETALAGEHGVSRPTVREALARLREDGLIVSRRGSGAYVLDAAERITRVEPLASFSDLKHCFDYRIGLESEAARLAATNRTDIDIGRIGAAYQAMDATNKKKRTGMEGDFAFHMAVSRASANRFFVAGLEQVRAHVAQGMTINRTLSLECTAPRLVLVQAEHRAIMDAIVAGDAAAAAIAMSYHLRNAMKRMFEG